MLKWQSVDAFVFFVMCPAIPRFRVLYPGLQNTDRVNPGLADARLALSFYCALQSEGQFFVADTSSRYVRPGGQATFHITILLKIQPGSRPDRGRGGGCTGPWAFVGRISCRIGKCEVEMVDLQFM
jgi:hypothetical protein